MDAQSVGARSYGSRRSRGSRYRTVARAATVDESLFGTQTQRKPSQGGGAPRAVGSRDGPKRATVLRNTGKVLAQSSTVTLSREELARMKRNAVVLSDDQKRATKRATEAEKEARQAQARARKERMLKLEEERKRNAPPSKREIAKRQQREAIRSNATHLLQEQLDDVKAMNQMMEYAKCVAIRDMQKEEKEEKVAAERDEQRRLDLIMEIDRLRKLEHYDRQERAKLEQRLADRQVIVQQIEQRQKRREEMREAKRKEQAAMLERMREAEEAEKRKLEQRKARAAELQAEVAESNRRQVEEKRAALLKEVEEDRKIAEYLRQREEKERAEEEERQRRAHEREMEVARLRAMQEKHADEKAEMDALRARRAAEAAMREARRRELAEAEKRARQVAEMEEFRQQQHAVKQIALAREARRQKDEFERNRAVYLEALQKSKEEAERQRQRNLAHLRDIQSQINEAEAAKKRERSSFLEEGSAVRKARDAEIERLRAIKASKVKQLRDAGVPNKYIVELENYDPEKALVQDYKLGKAV